MVWNVNIKVLVLAYAYKPMQLHQASHSQMEERWSWCSFTNGRLDKGDVFVRAKVSWTCESRWAVYLRPSDPALEPTLAYKASLVVSWKPYLAPPDTRDSWALACSSVWALRQYTPGFVGLCGCTSAPSKLATPASVVSENSRSTAASACPSVRLESVSKVRLPLSSWCGRGFAWLSF